jgi:hypothetical protein
MTTSTAYGLRLKDWERLMSSEEKSEWDAAPWISQCIELYQEFTNLVSGSEVSVKTQDSSRDSFGLKLFMELAFYGRYGALLVDRPESECASWIDMAVAKTKRMHRLTPAGVADEVPVRILEIVESRRRVESDSGVISPLGLALLGGVSEGRIKNLMFGAGALFNAVDGKISVPQAVGWLEGRSGYWPSIWQEDETNMTGEDFVTVPQASDSTVFHPGLRRRNGYMVGAKGAEQVIENFDDALTFLAQEREPRWRRPNPEGNWGIVKGMSWITMSRRELNQLRT